MMQFVRRVAYLAGVWHAWVSVRREVCNPLNQLRYYCIIHAKMIWVEHSLLLLCYLLIVQGFSVRYKNPAQMGQPVCFIIIAPKHTKCYQFMRNIINRYFMMEMMSWQWFLLVRFFYTRSYLSLPLVALDRKWNVTKKGSECATEMVYRDILQWRSRCGKRSIRCCHSNELKLTE